MCKQGSTRIVVFQKINQLSVTVGMGKKTRVYMEGGCGNGNGGI